MTLSFNQLCELRGGRTPSLDAEIRAAMRSGRGGSGGRTFHFKVSSLTRAHGAKTVASRCRYTVAEPGSGHSREDLEGQPMGLVGEDRAALIDALDGAVTRANGKLALNLHVELPAAFSPEQRAEVLSGLVERFESQGFPVLAAAVHADGRARDGQPQPHAHLVVSARPATRQADGSWTVEPPGVRGRPGRPGPIPGPAALQALRAEVAGIINAVAERDLTPIAVHQAADGALAVVPWHGGTLNNTGIKRPALPRRPVSVIRAPDGFRDRSPGRAMAAARAEARCRAGTEIERDAVTASRAAWAQAQRGLAASRLADRLAVRAMRAARRQATAQAKAVEAAERLAARRRWRRGGAAQAPAPPQAAPEPPVPHQAPQAAQRAPEPPQAPAPPTAAPRAPAPSQAPPRVLEPPPADRAPGGAVEAQEPLQGPPVPLQAQRAPEPPEAAAPTSWLADEGRAYPNRAAAITLGALSGACDTSPLVTRMAIRKAAAHANRLQGVEPGTPLAAYVSGVTELAAEADALGRDGTSQQNQALAERVRKLAQDLAPKLEHASQIAGEGKVIPPLSVTPGQEDAARLKLSGEPLARLAKLREATIAAFHNAPEQSRQRDDFARGFQIITRLESEQRPQAAHHQTTRIPGKSRGE